MLVLGGCDPLGEPPPGLVPLQAAPAGPGVLLRFPIAERTLILDRVMGVDHDPDEYEGVEQVHCINYAGDGYPYCYDGHDGSDFDLIDGFETMDAGSATVVAGAAGEVIAVEDSHYDRCHLDRETLGVDCDGNPILANEVVLLHPGGITTAYRHLMQGSARVAVGDWVESGTPLGLVGSSGYSTAPHLHLELRGPSDEIIDPYAGPWSQPDSWWCEQLAFDGLPGEDCG